MEQTGAQDMGPGGVPKGSQTHEYYRIKEVPGRFDNPGCTPGEPAAPSPPPPEEGGGGRKPPPTGAAASLPVEPRLPPRREPGTRLPTILNVPGTPVAPWAYVGSGQVIRNNPGNVISTCSYPPNLPAGMDFEVERPPRPYDENGEFHAGGVRKGTQTHELYRLSERLPLRFDNPEWFQGYGGKKQHPMYLTTSAQYGAKPPSVHTVPTQFYARSQKFSEHLGQCGMYRNYSLNTESDKSMF